MNLESRNDRKWKSIWMFSQDNFDGLVQERSNSIANALELSLSCTNPSIWAEFPNNSRNVAVLYLLLS